MCDFACFYEVEVREDAVVNVASHLLEEALRGEVVGGRELESEQIREKM